MLRIVTVPCDPGPAAGGGPTAPRTVLPGSPRLPIVHRQKCGGNGSPPSVHSYKDHTQYSGGCGFFSYPPRRAGLGAKRTYFAVEGWGGAAQQYGGISQSLACARVGQAPANRTFSGRALGVTDAAGLGTSFGKPYVWAK